MPGKLDSYNKDGMFTPLESIVFKNWVSNHATAPLENPFLTEFTFNLVLVICRETMCFLKDMDNGRCLDN